MSVVESGTPGRPEAASVVIAPPWYDRPTAAPTGCHTAGRGQSIPSSADDLINRLAAEVDQLLAPTPELRAAFRSNWSGVSEQVFPDDRFRAGPCSVQPHSMNLEYASELVGRQLEGLLTDARGGRVYDLRDVRDVNDLTARKTAIYFVTETLVRLVTSRDEQFREVQGAGDRLLEGAIAVPFVLDNLNGVNDRTGMNEAAPGLSDIDLQASAANPRSLLWGHLSRGVGAGRHLAGYFGRSLDQSTGQATEQGAGKALWLLNQQGFVGKQELVARWVLRDVPSELLTTRDNFGATPRDRIVGAMRNAFARLAEGRVDPSGLGIVGTLDLELQEIVRDAAVRADGERAQTTALTGAGAGQAVPSRTGVQPATDPPTRPPGTRRRGTATGPGLQPGQ